MANISPGVYSKIIDLSNYVQSTPSTIGFLPFLSEKGRDNELLFIGSRAELISEWGEPDITKYGKNYGQGLYNAYNFLGESGALYGIRCLPDDAAFSNIRIDGVETDTTATISISYVSSVNTTTELESDLTTSTEGICTLYPIGRGEYYNKLSVRFSEYSNTLVNGVYVIDIYEEQSDGDDVIIESFEVSFDPLKKDSSGDSMFIEYILETYSSVLRAKMTDSTDDYSTGYESFMKIYDQRIGTTSVILTDASAQISDNKQDFSDWNDLTGASQYVVKATDAKGNQIWGWLGTATGDDSEDIVVYTDKNQTTQSWNGDTTSFDIDSVIEYYISKTYSNIAQGFASSEPIALKKGSDGTLIDATGNLDTTVATQVLSQAYLGTIDSNVLDTEFFYFNIVFDAGYPSDVKTQISTLCQTRRDCVAIVDNTDNSSYTNAITSRQNNQIFNNYFVSVFEGYSKVYDVFTGNDVWFSPIYHMSYLLPRNDNVAELWYAAAGFNRGAIENIKELRYNPRLGQRDQFYLKQLNPVVQYRSGYVMMGNLTSQAKPSVMQNLSAVRLVLYIKKALEEYCRYFIFEQNDAIAHNQISVGIVEFLEVIKSKRGLESYNVDVGTTPYLRKTKTCYVNVTLVPVLPLEKIELNFYVK